MQTITTSSNERWTIGGRAVSDVIGYSLMFGIIISGVAIVSVAGVDDIVSFGDREEVTTGERGMEAAASTLDKINRQGDMNRSFDLVIGTGNIWVNETNLTIGGPSALTDRIGNSGRIQVNAIEHRFQREPEPVTVGYESGAVFRSDAAAARYQPSMVCDTDTNTAIVSVVNLTSADSSINVAVDYDRDFRLDPTDIPDESPVAAFAATLKLQADLVNVTSYTTQSASQNISIDVSDTSFPEQWGGELNDAGWSNAGSQHEYECDADAVVVRVSTISLRRLI
jgi:hypothetical protein